MFYFTQHTYTRTCFTFGGNLQTTVIHFFLFSFFASGGVTICFYSDPNTLALFVSAITICFGFQLGKSSTPDYAVYIMIVYVLYIIVFDVVFEVMDCMNKKEKAGTYCIVIIYCRDILMTISLNSFVITVSG